MKPIQEFLNQKLRELETHFDGDVISYFWSIVDGNENAVLRIIEELAVDSSKKDKVFIILTTPGGSATAVERYVNSLNAA